MLGGHPSHGVLAVGRHIRAQRRAAIGLGGGELRRGLRSVSMSDLYALSAHSVKFGLSLRNFAISWGSGESRGENGLSTLLALSNIESVDSVDSDGSCQIETLGLRALRAGVWS